MTELSIRKAHIEEIVSHAKEAYPKEACGILAGRVNDPFRVNDSFTVEKVYRVRNVDDSSVTYLMDSQEQFRVMKELQKAGLKMVAIYHSHTAAPAYPSPRDVKLAFYPDTAHVIVSLGGERPVVNAFLIEEGAVKKLNLRIL